MHYNKVDIDKFETDLLNFYEDYKSNQRECTLYGTLPLLEEIDNKIKESCQSGLLGLPAKQLIK